MKQTKEQKELTKEIKHDLTELFNVDEKFSKRSRENLNKKLTETHTASLQDSEARILPKGNVLEQQMKVELDAINNPIQPQQPVRPNIPVQPGQPNNKGRKPVPKSVRDEFGRVKRDTEGKIIRETQTTQQPVQPDQPLVNPDGTPFKRVDQIALMQNGILFPAISQWKDLDIKELMFTPDEMEIMLQLQPPGFMDKPSWVNYIICNLSITGMHFFKALQAKKELELLKEKKKQKEEGEKESRQPQHIFEINKDEKVEQTA